MNKWHSAVSLTQQSPRLGSLPRLCNVSRLGSLLDSTVSTTWHSFDSCIPPRQSHSTHQSVSSLAHTRLTVSQQSRSHSTHSQSAVSLALDSQSVSSLARTRLTVSQQSLLHSTHSQSAVTLAHLTPRPEDVWDSVTDKSSRT